MEGKKFQAHTNIYLFIGEEFDQLVITLECIVFAEPVKNGGERPREDYCYLPDDVVCDFAR